MEKWKITVASKKLKQDLESVIAMYTYYLLPPLKAKKNTEEVSMRMLS